MSLAFLSFYMKSNLIFVTLWMKSGLIHAVIMLIDFARCFVPRPKYMQKESLDVFPGHLIHDVCCLIAQKQELQVGKRACTYPDRIRRHVLYRLNFDEDDTSWLCTTISAFLVIIERTLIAKKRGKSS